MPDSTLSRRHLLGSALLATTAGCTAFRDDAGVQVGNLLIGNWMDDPVSLTVRLDRAGATVFEDALEIDADGEERIEQSWDAAPATYTLMYARAGAGPIHRISLPDEVDATGGCVDLQIHCREHLTDLVVRDDSPDWGRC